jgi:hypothetical protein
MATFDRFQLDGDWLAGLDVSSAVNVTERTGADFLPDAVLVANTKIHGLLIASGV